MAHGPASLHHEYALTRRSIASGLFEYRYQSDALAVVLIECGLISGVVGLKAHSLGIGIFTFLGFLTAFGIPYLRQLLALALTGVYVAAALAFAREIAAGDHHVLSGVDQAGIGLVVSLIAYGLHAKAMTWVQDLR
jgi:hypothetical protein